MRYALRCCTAALWFFFPFRWLVCEIILRFPGSFSNWLAVNTPFLVAVRENFLRSGDRVSAARVDQVLRDAGEA